MMASKPIAPRQSKQPCPKCGRLERKQGRPLCNRCMAGKDQALIKRWFEAKQRCRRRPSDEATATFERLTRELLE